MKIEQNMTHLKKNSRNFFLGDQKVIKSDFREVCTGQVKNLFKTISFILIPPIQLLTDLDAYMYVKKDTIEKRGRTR